ncbi:MAG TPA: deoxyhypusine synthase [Candidatus Nanoarchaeia archaeon]|nr:deoxyhypusine synthase [Candidatus Nanoarchaeia archaeon]
MQPVKDIKLTQSTTIKQLISEFHESGGFVAKKVADGAIIFEKMLDDKKCIKFLSFPAAIIATGCRGVIKDLVKRKLVDVIITTCGTLDHDLARCWKDYYHGSFDMDDAKLRKKGINRLGNVLVPNDSYGIVLEKKLLPIIESIHQKQQILSTRELCYEIGKRLDDEDSILYWAAKNNLPVFVPGITDGSVGSQIWMFRQKHPDFMIDVFKDEQELAAIVFDAKKTGALMIGGGISKHHTIWWNQFKDGLNYVVYITTAPEWDGSLSGARVKEGISWGKVAANASHVTIEGDATVLLPLVVGNCL